MAEWRSWGLNSCPSVPESCSSSFCSGRKGALVQRKLDRGEPRSQSPTQLSQVTMRTSTHVGIHSPNAWEDLWLGEAGKSMNGDLNKLAFIFLTRQAVSGLHVFPTFQPCIGSNTLLLCSVFLACYLFLYSAPQRHKTATAAPAFT